ncbi:hypothetical protein [Microcoleus sp.]|uniref:hypothetical protein n=1 Tax=Microcoleus sp. TaxID=44472 RepID=UPI0035250490
MRQIYKPLIVVQETHNHAPYNLIFVYQLHPGLQDLNFTTRVRARAQDYESHSK